jgi:2',3'-cyclic-nucleotide 2'-phosphodiesterase (5'-nucleotidase family)
VVYGKDQLLAVMNDYGAPVVCSNMYHDTGNGPGDYLFAPVHVKEVAGVRIGFLSFNDPLVPVRQDPVYSKGIRFTGPEANAAEWIRHLREQERCDLVLALTHMGIGQQFFLANQPFMAGVDYILGADTHERVRTPLKGSVTQVTEPGAFGSFVGRLDLVVENGTITDATYDLMEVAESRYPEHDGMRRLVQEVKRPYRNDLEVVVGTTSTPLLRYFVLETPMDNLITDALFESVQTELKGRGMQVDVALSNGFRFSPPLVPSADTGIAEINREHLWSMLPVDSTARVATVPGTLVKPWLEKELNNVFAEDATQRFGGWVIRMKGMTVNFTARAPKGERINRITIGDRPLDPNRDYVFAACERGGDPPDVLCRITGVRDRFDLSFTLHDAVERYLRAHSPVAPEIEGRVVATDLPQTTLGQLPGTEYQFH